MENEVSGDLGKRISETMERSRSLLENAGLPKEVRGRKAAFVYFNGGFSEYMIDGLEIVSCTINNRKAGTRKEHYVQLVTTPCIFEDAPVLFFKITTSEQPWEGPSKNIFECVCTTGKGITVGYLILL